MKNSIKQIQSESLLSALLSARILRKANTYKYIALATLALGFAACSQDDNFAPQQEDIVKIASANIATEVQTRVNTLGDGTLWENNDQILLVNDSRTTKNSGTYTATVTTGDNPTTTWALANGTVLYASSGTNNFTAYYPASVDFTLPTDQSDEAKIKSADRMVATATDVAKGADVALSFERQNAKVTIIPQLNTEFDSSASISSLQIAGITPYHPTDAEDYKAIIAPATGFEVSVKVKVGETEQTLTATTSTVIEAGKHYTFNLTVGKEAVVIDYVNVSLWTEVPITGVESDEYFLPDVDATSLTATQLEEKLLSALYSGHTEITVTLAADAAGEMFVAINNALNSSGAAESSIDLTIAGVQVIPSSALGDGDNADPVALKTLNLPDAVKLEMNALTLPKVQTVYAPKVTEWEIWGIWNAFNITTIVLTAPGTITADFTELITENINLTLHKDKESEVTNSNQWNDKTWNSITFAE